MQLDSCTVQYGVVCMYNILHGIKNSHECEKICEKILLCSVIAFVLSLKFNGGSKAVKVHLGEYHSQKNINNFTAYLDTNSDL